MKNNRLKQKVKDFTRSRDLAFLMKGWEHPGESEESVKAAYEEKFNKEGEEDERCGGHSEESVSAEEEEKGVPVQEG
jgi:hypothetical protein